MIKKLSYALFVESDNEKTNVSCAVLTNFIQPCPYNNGEKGDVMYYEIYVDSLFLINFVMNLYLLMLVNISVHRTAAWWRLLCGAGLGAVLYLLPFIWEGPGMLKLVTGLCLGTVGMLFVSFRIQNVRTFFRLLEKLLLYSFLLGGILLFLLRSFPGCRRFLTGVFGICSMGTAAFFGLYIFGRKQRERSCICNVTLICKEGRMRVNALIDSGNSLREPISGKPVSVIEKNILYALLGQEPDFYRAIPYHSVGRNRGILKGYLLQELQIELVGGKKICRNVCIAIGDETIAIQQEGKQGIGMILHPALLEEKSD